MTPTVEELREWSARLMGWKDVGNYYSVAGDRNNIICTKEDTSFGNGWRPDLDLNQAFMIVERMRELGWALHFSGQVENTDYGVGFAREYSVDRNLNLYKTAPAHAILLAAYATGEGR